MIPYLGNTSDGSWNSLLDHQQFSHISDVTQILEPIENGDAKSAEQLLSLVYDELLRHECRRSHRRTRGFACTRLSLLDLRSGMGAC
ncbi:ECF-type sigma factor [Stieleria sp. ICT_E10.1]|nr:ECF-type sigma factor [Stieleria sedimenti]MCS7468106.1 ECF-type sigma factor [Stieleria sedimenti]